MPFDPPVRAPLRLAAPLAGAALLLGASGCEIFREGPRIEVDGLQVLRRGPDAAEGDLLISIRTPAGRTIPLDDFRYSLIVDGRTVFRGRWAALAAVPPGETIRRTLPVTIPLEALPERVASDEVPLRWAASGSVGWEDPQRLARILFDLGLPNPRSDFSGRGEVAGAAPAVR
jgi:hypothetical protein